MPRQTALRRPRLLQCSNVHRDCSSRSSFVDWLDVLKSFMINFSKIGLSLAAVFHQLKLFSSDARAMSSLYSGNSWWRRRRRQRLFNEELRPGLGNGSRWEGEHSALLDKKVPSVSVEVSSKEILRRSDNGGWDEGDDGEGRDLKHRRSER